MDVPTCLVTGSSGLIGSAVASYFSARGCDVHGVDSNQRAVFFGPAGDTRANLERLQRTLRNFHHHSIDIRDRVGIADLIGAIRPALIVHAASQPSHDRAAAIPFDDFETNAVGTLNLLEAARNYCKESPFVFMSTNKVYGDLPNTIPLAELPTRWDYSDPAFAHGVAETLSVDQSTHSLFGASKLAADVLVQEYGRYFGMPTCCLRAGCVTGPNHAAVELHGFLSYLVKCNLESREYRVFGYKAKQVRDNIHADDVAAFAHAFWKAPRAGEVYNLGGGKSNSCSILEAFDLVASITLRPQVHTYVDEARRGDHICYYSDLRKIRSHYPDWDITKSLAGTVREIVETLERSLFRLMRILITGICGFVGSELALGLRRRLPDAQLAGIDNFSRPGSETTRPRLKAAGVGVKFGDVRCAGDLDAAGDADWVIDAAANPSVLAGVDGRTTSRQIVDHNLSGTLNILEFCKQRGAGLVLLSTSRVYSVQALGRLPLVVDGLAFAPDQAAAWPLGASPAGLSETFSTEAPLSLYGATKLASEVVAIEYGHAFDLPIAVNRCGVIAGAGQFGTAEQGIFSYWVRAWASGRDLRYLGFDGAGHQVRDALHPQDLADLVERQIRSGSGASGIYNVGGGRERAMSLAQLSAWCAGRFGAHTVASDATPRRWDVPWVVMDSARAGNRFGWAASCSLPRMLDEIADHHQRHPDWLSLTQPL